MGRLFGGEKCVLIDVAGFIVDVAEKEFSRFVGCGFDDSKSEVDETRIQGALKCGLE